MRSWCDVAITLSVPSLESVCVPRVQSLHLVAGSAASRCVPRLPHGTRLAKSSMILASGERNPAMIKVALPYVSGPSHSGSAGSIVGGGLDRERMLATQQLWDVLTVGQALSKC